MNFKYHYFLLLLLSLSIPSLAYEHGQNVIFNMHGYSKLGVITGVTNAQYFINEPSQFTDSADGKVFYKGDIQDYESISEYTESKFLVFGRNETWSVGDHVMIEWNGGLQKATIGDLTSSGLVYFSSVSNVNLDSFGLGNRYFPMSIIRNRYNGLTKIEYDGKLFKLGDHVLLEDRHNRLYDKQDLYSGKIIDINSDGEIRIDYLHKRGRFYGVQYIQHLQSVNELHYKNQAYSIDQEVIVRWNGGLHKTFIVDIDSTGYVLVEKFRYKNGYIKINDLID